MEKVPKFEKFICVYKPTYNGINVGVSAISLSQEAQNTIFGEKIGDDKLYVKILYDKELNIIKLIPFTEKVEYSYKVSYSKSIGAKLNKIMPMGRYLFLQKDTVDNGCLFQKGKEDGQQKSV